jgi:hypothetical protein
MDVREQRVRFVVAASRQEKPFSALGEEFGISRPTGMLCYQRYQQWGGAGIAERSRRPQHGPRRTEAELEQLQLLTHKFGLRTPHRAAP